MPAAANIDEAIAFLPENVIFKFGALAASMDLWLVVFSATQPPFPAPGEPFDAENREQRSVRDWFGPSVLVRNNISETNLAEQQVSGSAIIDIVNRALTATKYAAIAGRITADQETSVVNQYNTAWA